MVFSANSAVVDDGRVLTARFRHPERAPEQRPYRQWFARRGFREIRAARAICEGEGDVIFVGSVALAGWGFRTTRSAHHELQEFFGRPVVGLRLCDPCYYHLDMALCAVDDKTVVYNPRASTIPPQSTRARAPLPRRGAGIGRRLCRLRCRTQRRNLTDATSCSRTSRRTALLRSAPRAWVRAHDHRYVRVAKAGGGVKCCTLENEMTMTLLLTISIDPCSLARGSYGGAQLPPPAVHADSSWRGRGSGTTAATATSTCWRPTRP